MNNIAAIGRNELAPLYGEKRRPAEILEKEKLAGLKDYGQNFETYTIAKGDVIRFPKYEDMIVKVQPVREPMANEDKARIPKVAYVACELERNGVKRASWFNLNSLAKRDYQNKPVMQDWYDLGNANARAAKLAEVGAITSTESVDIQVTKFDGNAPVRKKELGADGVYHELNEYETRTQTVNLIVPFAE